jgi:hypothetical protein
LPTSTLWWLKYLREGFVDISSLHKFSILVAIAALSHSAFDGVLLWSV